MDVTLHAGRSLQGHGHSADGAGCPTAHDHALGGDCTRHPSLLADDDLSAGHITFEVAINLQDASADDLEALTGDPKVVADNGFSGLRGARATERTRAARTGVGRPERDGCSGRGTRHDVFLPWRGRRTSRQWGNRPCASRNLVRLPHLDTP